MFHLRFEAKPKKTHPKFGEYPGATVSCWIKRDTLADAKAVARGWIADEDWRISAMKHAGIITKETQSPEGISYFEQAEIDREFFVFHTWPIGAHDDKNHT